jgi:hypothetical protein
LALAVACSFVCHPEGICLAPAVARSPPPTKNARGAPYLDFEMWDVDLSSPVFALARYSLLVTHYWFTKRLRLTPGNHPAPIPLSSPFLFLPLSFSPPSADLRALRVRPPKPASLQANPPPQTIFHAFTQQNRMSSPQAHQKTNNSNPIKKIKVSQKRFLVMVNQVQLN